MQSSKPSTSYGSPTPSKGRKNSKDRDKRRSGSISAVQVENNSNNSAGSEDKEKSSPSKDSKEFAGIDCEIIKTYAEQNYYKFLSDDVCNTLAEDINYKLRYIIHNSLLSARLQGKEAISSEDIDETFSNLTIDKVYGAPSSPNWVQFCEPNFSYLALEDPEVNLIDIAEEDTVYAQEGDIFLEHTWLTDPMSDDSQTEEAFRDYFVTMCQAVISCDADLRKTALQDISENSSIGPITEWFYHFAYFLLMKDITYDRLTLRALYLLDTLENSPLPSQTVSVKQLKLLVRLLLQRLLISVTTKDVLKPMCSVLATLCLRPPLHEMVVTKINQKMFSVCQQMALPLLTSIYFLGIDAVKKIFLPNMKYFLARISQNERDELDLTEIILVIYGLICKARLNENSIHMSFSYTFDYLLVPYWVPLGHKPELERVEIDFINMKKQLVKARRKVDRNFKRVLPKSLEEVFDIPLHNCKVRKKLDEFRNGFSFAKKETKITVGKTSLLLSILNTNKAVKSCRDHSLLSYNF